jgi:hypothetical protein
MQGNEVDLLFPSRAIEPLMDLRGEKWKYFVTLFPNSSFFDQKVPQNYFSNTFFIKKIKIFEKTEQPKITKKTTHNRHLPLLCRRRRLLMWIRQKSTNIIYDRRDEHQRQKPIIPPPIKNVAGHQKHQVLAAVVEQTIEDQHTTEQYHKLVRNKTHLLFSHLRVQIMASPAFDELSMLDGQFNMTV